MHVIMVPRMGPAKSAIDLPKPRIEIEVGRRRHRRLTGSAGLLLFICLFLPAVKGCSEPIYPVSMPMFWHPYVYGLVFAFGTATVSLRGLRYTIVALRVLAWLTVVGAGLLVIATGGPGIVELVIGSCLIALIGTRGYCERRMALTAIAVGAMSLLWFGLWVITDSGLVGVYLSTVASFGLLVGGLVWLAELTLARPPPILLPHAQARRRE